MNTLPETNSLPLKIVGWKTSFLLGCLFFQVRAVSMREGISIFLNRVSCITGD